jgi:hypothetical protein
MTTLSLALQPNAEQQVETRLQIRFGEWTSFSGRQPPLFVPSDQLYYWTRKWQDGEKEALADLEAGRSRIFEDANELARYLTRPPE